MRRNGGRLAFVLMICALYAAAALLCAVLLLRHAAALMRPAGLLFRIREDTVAYAVQSLAQLKTAKINAPVFGAAAISLLLHASFFVGAARGRINRRRMTLCLAACFVPAVLACLCMLEVNGVRLSALLKSFLPMLL